MLKKIILTFITANFFFIFPSCTEKKEVVDTSSVVTEAPDNGATLLKHFKSKVEKRDDIAIVLRSASVSGAKNVLSLWVDPEWKKIGYADRKDGFSKLCKLWMGLHPVA